MGGSRGVEGRAQERRPAKRSREKKHIQKTGFQVEGLDFCHPKPAEVILGF